MDKVFSSNIVQSSSVAVMSLALSLCFALALMASALQVSDASAHQQKMAISTVLFNPRTQNIEIMHRFNLHDAEHAVKEIFDGKADIIANETTQADFAKYVIDRFAIYTLDNKALKLSFVGTELDGKHFWVYQEAPAPKSLDGMVIEHNALRDIWHKQTNTINVEGVGDIQTLTFTDNTELLSVEFKHH